MRSYKRIINILILVLVINLFLIGCRGTNSDKIIANKSDETVSINSNQTKIIDEKLDAGEISNNVYVNKYLGLSFKGFTDWYIQDGIIKELLQGKEIKNINTEASTTIIGIFRYKIGSTKEFNPSFILTIENAKNRSSIDFLNSIKEEFKKNSQRYSLELEEDIHQETLSGQTYDVFGIKVNMGKGYVHQKHYCKKVKDYLIVFNFAYSTKEQLKDFDSIKGNLVIKL